MRVGSFDSLKAFRKIWEGTEVSKRGHFCQSCISHVEQMQNGQFPKKLVSSDTG